MSAAVVPILAALVIIYALMKRVDVYDAFVKGALEGLPILYKVVPYMAAMLIAIELLNVSGIMEWLTTMLLGPLQKIGMPPELLPMALLRPFSGSAAMAIVNDVFEKYGVDSLLGAQASTMMGSSETIFYTLALYFGSVGITKTRFTLPVALLASVVSVAASIIICNLLF
ncbi:spore maturation protein [Christensenellaceae bacterium OttesenSCG-928-M15]|nr:spore maturation protein [Christensenellaceae bacterium OttesenSCG-928-M15]